MFFKTNISFLGDFSTQLRQKNIHTKALDLIILPKKSTFKRVDVIG
jgi:hypothetical protein